MLLNEQVHAARVVVDAAAIVGSEVRVNAQGSLAKAHHALDPVMWDEPGAEHLGQLPVGAAAVGIHLPQAILRGHVALRDEEIGLVGRLNVRHAVSIAAMEITTTPRLSRARVQRGEEAIFFNFPIESGPTPEWARAGSSWLVCHPRRRGTHACRGSGRGSAGRNLKDGILRCGGSRT